MYQNTKPRKFQQWNFQSHVRYSKFRVINRKGLLYLKRKLQIDDICEPYVEPVHDTIWLSILSTLR